MLFGIASFGVALFSLWGLNSIPDNIISINLSALSDNISWLTSINSSKSYQNFFTKKLGLRKETNVIVVFAESLSPIDSLRVGGIHDNLPYFDLIQKQGITFTNFINNGCTSDTAHIGVLMGIEPLKILWVQSTSYSGYKSTTDGLATFFNNQWYVSTFISSVDLWFLNQRDFLANVWFTHIIGEEKFVNEKKYVFDAAPDHVLYNKTLETVKQQKKPFFIALQTISFHKPYDTPYGKNQKDALRYADKSLFYFYLQLKKTWFFNSGVLVIVGDHRKMEPLEDKEKEAFSNDDDKDFINQLDAMITPESKKASENIKDLLKKANGEIKLTDDDLKESKPLGINTNELSNDKKPNALRDAQKETYELINTVNTLKDTLLTLSPVLSEGKKLMNMFESVKLNQ